MRNYTYHVRILVQVTIHLHLLFIKKFLKVHNNVHSKGINKWSPEDKIEVLKDVKVKNILHNCLDHVMANRVYSMQNNKGNFGMLWRFNVKAQRRLRKTRRAILIQEYEYF